MLEMDLRSATRHCDKLLSLVLCNNIDAQPPGLALASFGSRVPCRVRCFVSVAAHGTSLPAPPSFHHAAHAAAQAARAR